MFSNVCGSQLKDGIINASDSMTTYNPKGFMNGLRLFSIAVLSFTLHVQADLIDLGTTIGDIGDEGAWIMNDQGLSVSPIHFGSITLNAPPGARWTPGEVVPLPSGFEAFWSNQPLTVGTGWHTSLSGYFVSYLLVQGSAATADITFNHLYGVAADQRFDGISTVTIDGQVPVTRIMFFGGSVSSVPEGGATCVLLLAALSLLGLARRT